MNKAQEQIDRVTKLCEYARIAQHKADAQAEAQQMYQERREEHTREHKQAIDEHSTNTKGATNGRR